LYLLVIYCYLAKGNHGVIKGSIKSLKSLLSEFKKKEKERGEGCLWSLS
jgi:hypothetical protein